jgi:acetolactate synthase-1/2/3 large subunit
MMTDRRRAEARPSARRRVADHIVEHLAAIGVEHIFGVGGANIEDLYDAAYFQREVTAILAKHEFSAATMADGYSRSGAGLGVVMATSGGGCLNTVSGLGESLASRVPVLALIGQPPTMLDGRGAFQDTSGRNGALNGEALFSAVSVFCRRIVQPGDIVSALPRRTRAVEGLRPARVGDRDLHPHHFECASPDRRLPLRMGPGQAPETPPPPAQTTAERAGR